MATEERLPPACAFAISVLAEYDQNPEAVPEEAVEAAQQHITSCERCVAAFATPAEAQDSKLDVATLYPEVHAHLPQDQQPAIMVGGEFVQPRLLRGLVQWARQQQLALPHIVALQATAARPPADNNWQKQFYASFCTSFATAGSYCSGAATLDQGALFFADGISMITRAVSAASNGNVLPTRAALVQKLQSEAFTGVSGSITLQVHNHVLINTDATPVVVSIQQDGTLQIVT